jgi:hypothetical protein
MPYSSISPTFFFKLFALGPAKKLACKLRHVENINQIVYVFEIRKQLKKTHWGDIKCFNVLYSVHTVC